MVEWTSELPGVEVRSEEDWLWLGVPLDETTLLVFTLEDVALAELVVCDVFDELTLLVFTPGVVTLAVVELSMTDLVVYATTVVFRGVVVTRVFVMAKRQDLRAMESRQLVVLVVKVESE